MIHKKKCIKINERPNESVHFLKERERDRERVHFFSERSEQ